MNRMAGIPSRFPSISRTTLSTLQVNLGYRCNQACSHCHVDAGPNRREQMSPATIALVLAFIDQQDLSVLDITGGAPELHPQFRKLVRCARQRRLHVIDRCNLTVLEEPGQDSLAAFLAAQGVEIIASLPCYTQENVDLQRGKGVFEKSIRALRVLNKLGYGDPSSKLQLNLVYNPTGAFLPPDQAQLEENFRVTLGSAHGVRFNHLLTLANMPIARFRQRLERDGALGEYYDLLVRAHREANLSQVMCRSTLSIDWRGYTYDCDFNQMLGTALGGNRDRTHLSALLERNLCGAPIAVAAHCFACTAGQGSSCQGALST